MSIQNWCYKIATTFTESLIFFDKKDRKNGFLIGIAGGVDSHGMATVTVSPDVPEIMEEDHDATMVLQT